VHLVPAEVASANDVLRYAETNVQSDDSASFTLRHLAPGRYWVLVRAVPDDEPSELPPRPLAWDAEARIRLRREAQARKVEIELKACQVSSGNMLYYQAK
jgi:hypothetical protein